MDISIKRVLFKSSVFLGCISLLNCSRYEEKSQSDVNCDSIINSFSETHLPKFERDDQIVSEINIQHHRIKYYKTGSKITYLQLTGDKISEFYNQIYSLDSINYIEIKETSITRIPELKKFIHLDTFTFYRNATLDSVYLDLLGTRISSIGISSKIRIFKFSESYSLISMDLSDNEISNVDSSIFRLHSLESLYLASNQITNIDLSRMKRLKYLNLRNNPLIDTVEIRRIHPGVDILMD